MRMHMHVPVHVHMHAHVSRAHAHATCPAPKPRANALCRRPRAIAPCQAKLIADLRANSKKSRANKLLRNAQGAGFSAAAAAAAVGQAGAPDGRSALIGALRSMTAAAAAAEKPAAADTTAPAFSAEVATLAQSAAVSELATPAAVAGFTARTARTSRTAPVAPGDSPEGDPSQEMVAPRKKVPSLVVPPLKLTPGQASRRAMRPARED